MTRSLTAVSNLQQRKSRRLVARAVKEKDSKRPEDELALSETLDGGAAFLLERCSENELAFLTSQVSHQCTLTEVIFAGLSEES